MLSDLIARLNTAYSSTNLGGATNQSESVLPTGLADVFQAALGGGLTAQFGGLAGDRLSARVLLPEQAAAPLRIEDASTGMALDVLLRDARKVAAQVADGYVVYPNAHASGADLLHRPLPGGIEDFLSFQKKPRVSSISYQVDLRQGVAGLRLVENTLEMLDAGGAPRLRVAPPFLVGADGARTDAMLAIAGCAVDKSAAPPWGRRVTAPGAASCTLRVSWRADVVVYPAVLDPRWTTTTTMKAKRQNHTATLLSTGKVLVVGGTDGTNALNTAELFDPATGTWTATPTFTGGRQLHTAVQLGTNANATTSGKVLIAGGWNGGTTTTGAAVNTALLYNVTAGTWSAATVLNAIRAMHTATVLPNGQVLVAGGMSDTATVLNTAALYDPTTGTGTWTATGTMAIKARFHTATLMPTTGPFANKVVVVGGNTGGTTSTAVVQLFSGTTWTSTGIAQLAAAREGHTASLLANGNILLTGGKAGATLQNTTLLFNAATAPGTWASAGTMNATHAGHTATVLSTSVLSSGQVLVAGGAPTTTNSAELWNGTTTWTATTALPSVIAGHTATLLSNKLILVAGGTSAAGASAAQLYDPSFALTCTTNSQCASGFCASGVCCDTACNGACVACNLAGKVGTCSAVAAGTTCNDSNACTTGETCQAGVCGAGTAVTCSAADTCHTVGACVPATGCPAPVAKADNTACNDSNACTTGETCHAGVCNAGTAVTCTTDQCHTVGACVPATGCPAAVAKANGTTCNDANACTTGETCQAGTCGSGAAVTCTGADACHTVGACVPATGCPAAVAKANGATCNDANACTTGETCQSGVCGSGTAVTCTTDQCHTIGACVPATGCPAAVAKANGAACNDANACTTGEACQAGVCSGGNLKVCTASDQCHVAGTCAPATGLCSNPAAANGTTCSDGKTCTTADGCTNGVCSGTLACAPPSGADNCQVGSCAGNGTCSFTFANEGGPCNDGNSCTTGETCQLGTLPGNDADYMPGSGFVSRRRNLQRVRAHPAAPDTRFDRLVEAGWEWHGFERGWAQSNHRRQRCDGSRPVRKWHEVRWYRLHDHIGVARRKHARCRRRHDDGLGERQR